MTLLYNNKPKVFLERPAMRQRQNIVLFSFFLILLTAAAWLFTIGVRADINDYSKTLLRDIINFFTGEQVKECKKILLGEDGGFLEKIIGEDGIGTIIGNALKGIGAFLAFIYCVSAAIKEMYRGDASWEMWSKVILKVVIAVAVIMFSDTIVDGIRTLGEGFLNILNTALLDFDFVTDLKNTVSEAQGESFLDTLFNGITGIWQAVSIVPKLLIPWLGLQIFTIIIKVMSYSFFFEFALRRAFMPIALANIVSGGLHSPGFMYLKKYFGLFVKMFIVLLTLTVSWHIVLSSIETNSGGNVLNAVGDLTGFSGAITSTDCLFVLFAGATVMKNASNYADDVLGLTGTR